MSTHHQPVSHPPKSGASLDYWLDYIEKQHPREIELGLDRVREVHGRLGLRGDAGKAISIAGTNGKGSCACYLEAIYLAAGLRVGVYTSPHLQHYRERIRVNGTAVEDRLIVAALEQIEAARDSVSLTYFEYGTLAALSIFKKEEVDLCILEVGMGGRLDAVNIIDAEVAVITTIALDHQRWLGNNRESIAFEKAGILRSGRPAICGDRDLPKSLVEHAAQIESPLLQAGSAYSWEKEADQWSWTGVAGKFAELPLPLFGAHEQLANAATALAAVEQMQLYFSVTRENIVSGLRRARLAGRFQKIKARCHWILDVAHNDEAARALARSLGESSDRTIAVIALMQDKAVETIAAALKTSVDEWIVVSDDHPRSLSSEQLAARLYKVLDAPIHCADSIVAGLARADSMAEATDRIVVTGSFHVVGPALDYLSQQSDSSSR